MTQPTVNLVGRVKRFTTKATQTDHGPIFSTQVVLDIGQISGNLEDLVGYAANITITGLQAKFGEKEAPIA